jgi:2-C-methyl-D-erythritol 2,4-cyclodiphosphate synthase
MLREREFGIVHVDATVMIEEPKISPVRDEMRSALAAALGIEGDRMSVKATRGEGMGFVGRGEGAACLAVATVEK